MQNDSEEPYLSDPETDREWLESELAELQKEEQIHQDVNAIQINQMLQIQAKIGYGSAIDLVYEHFPALLTAQGRESLTEKNTFVVKETKDKTEDYGQGPLTNSQLHFDFEGINQNAFRFYCKNDEQNNYIIHVIHIESGKTDRVSGRNLEKLLKQAIASGLTLHCEFNLDQIRNFLQGALTSERSIGWEQIGNAYEDINPKPVVPCYRKDIPDEPKIKQELLLNYFEYPPEPQRSDHKYKLVSAILKVQENAFIHDYEAWAEKIKTIEQENQRRYDENVLSLNRRTSDLQVEIAIREKTLEQIEAENKSLLDKYELALVRWNTEKLKYEEELARQKAECESLQPGAIRYFFERVLSISKFPNNIRREINVEYVLGSKILIVDHALPAPNDLIYVKNVNYVKTTDKFFRKKLTLADPEFKSFYDDTLYQICLRTFHEIFEADNAGALESVVFNGWVRSIDKATGKDSNGCVMSVHVKKDEFKKINLARVDPKACFKALKGIGSSALHSITPVAPVLKINREDKRFIASHEVIGLLDERSNLAVLDWEDFEHLIRELFEKEFSKSGSEVKVTQASRDGGVDAVVFDPDPIHGGKTIIQAKRYTNTVGVAAVRELYGTVHNEGAMKGILVTTADYGPDAYEFAKGKPLVLLNGANLLQLLEKHGHKAKIDIQEAKRILSEKVSLFHP